VATAIFKPYSNFPLSLANKLIDMDTDVIKCALATSSYTPLPDTHDFFDDITGELAATLGYTAGGATLGSLSMSIIAANSWATAAAVTTAYVVGDVRRPSTGNGFLYRCVVAGTSGGSAPTWGTVVGRETSDGTVVWLNVGRAVYKFSSATISWPSATFVAVRYAILYDSSPGTAATRPLIALADFGSDQAGGGGSFDIVPDAVSGLFLGHVLA
jgi:hypothetical protein